MTNPPEWLAEFTDRVTALIMAVDVLAPIGCHFCCEAGVWEVTLFAARTEVLGGPRDGQQRSSRFFLDLAGLTRLFDSVTAFHWQAHSLGKSDDLGAHVAIEGDVDGKPVWLRIPSHAPAMFDPGRVALMHDRRWEEAW
jgi:hypothetical protein